MKYERHNLIVSFIAQALDGFGFSMSDIHNVLVDVEILLREFKAERKRQGKH